MKGGLNNKAPYVFVKEGYIYVSAENGDNYADYYEYTIDEKLEDLADTIHTKGIEVVIVDEAHYFRNQDSADYESLLTICRDRTVILLTATPFNNSPADIFSLLKLFIVPGKSGITIDDNLEGLFRAFNYKYKRLSDIIKNWNSNKPAKRQKAERVIS